MFKRTLSARTKADGDLLSIAQCPAPPIGNTLVCALNDKYSS